MSSTPLLPTEVIDLTRLLDQNLPAYTEGAYSDPPFQMDTWCKVEGQGFKVSQLSLGTQTGTHIDAPAHFVAQGAELETLPAQALMGPYWWLDLNEHPDRWMDYHGQAILFLAAQHSNRIEISLEIFQRLLEVACRVWVIACSVQVAAQEPFYFHRALAQAGKYLVEDLEEAQAARVRPGGDLFALPLRLSGASGAPCRVIVCQPPGG